MSLIITPSGVYSPESEHKATPEKSKEKNILFFFKGEDKAIFFENVNVLKDKDRLGNGSKGKGT